MRWGRSGVVQRSQWSTGRHLADGTIPQGGNKLGREVISPGAHSDCGTVLVHIVPLLVVPLRANRKLQLPNVVLVTWNRDCNISKASWFAEVMHILISTYVQELLSVIEKMSTSRGDALCPFFVFCHHKGDFVHKLWMQEIPRFTQKFQGKQKKLNFV